MDQQQQLSVTPDDLYALIGQLTVENRALRAMLARQQQEVAAGTNGTERKAGTKAPA